MRLFLKLLFCVAFVAICFQVAEAERQTLRPSSVAGAGTFTSFEGQVDPSVIKMSTDNDALQCTGGSAYGSAYGAGLELQGIGGSAPGDATIDGGAVTGADIAFQTHFAGSAIKFIADNNLPAFTMTRSGTDARLKGQTIDTSIYNTTNTSRTMIGGGSDILAAAGAYLALGGNDHGTINGTAYLASGTTGGGIVFQTNGNSQWAIDRTGGDLLPQTADTNAIGSDSIPVQEMYFGDATRIGRLADSNGNNSVVIGAHSNHDLELRANNTGHWKIAAATGNFTDLGTSKIILNDDLQLGTNDTAVIQFKDSTGNFDTVLRYDTGNNTLLRGDGSVLFYPAQTYTFDMQRSGGTGTLQSSADLGRIIGDTDANEFYIGSGNGTTATQGAFIRLTGDDLGGADAGGDLTLSAGDNAGSNIEIAGTLKNTTAANESTGAGTALLATNCPAVDCTTPYTWIKLISSDGSTVYMPAWK